MQYRLGGSMAQLTLTPKLTPDVLARIDKIAKPLAK
jgi:hypothetical protein